MSRARYGFILLAAGNSSRLGRPKALLPYRDTTLIGHTVREMQKLPDCPIVVVSGAEPGITAGIPDIETVYNPDWLEGMAASIRCGMTALADRVSEGVILAGCDQPAVSADLFKTLITRKEAGASRIVASTYADATGIPALFDRTYFSELLALKGEKGAKKLLKVHADDLEAVPFKGGERDIDTQQDYESWLSEG